MSANRTRLLLADDADLLARARAAIVSRPEFDVVTAASTDEAVRLASAPPAPGAVVMPAEGSIDGIQVCRAVKGSAGGRAVPVLLALPAEGSARRDACFAAGADDVLFAPVEAADITSALDRNGSAFRDAPRAEVELVVRLASPTGNAVIDAKGRQISREAILVELPAGIASPAPGVLVRAVFTLYEGGTLQVWARVAPSADSTRTVLRFVGLNDTERRAIDYFVDFYRQRAGASGAATPTPASSPATAAAASADGGTPTATSPEELILSADASVAAGPSAQELILSAEVPPAPPSARGADISETVRLVCAADLDRIAETAALFAAGRSPDVPPGFDGARIRGWLPKLSSAETSALRGTTMYNSILGDLRLAAASKLRLFELAVALREGGTRLEKQPTERAALGAIAEAQQIHNSIEAAFQALLKGGNTAAVRDLTPVKAGLLTACVDLKLALDRDVLEKDPTIKRKPAPAAPRAPVTMDPAAFKNEPERPARAAKEKPRTDAAPSSGRKKALYAVILVALAAGAVWSNRSRFSPPPKRMFRPESVLFETNGIRVWTLNADAASRTMTWVIDGTWEVADEAARSAAVEDLVQRSAGQKRVIVIDYKGRELAVRDIP